MCMRFLCAGDSDMSLAVEKYDADVKDGAAPFPYPRYIQDPYHSMNIDACHDPCLLYRLLSLRASDSKSNEMVTSQSLSKVICPTGT